MFRHSLPREHSLAADRRTIEAALKRFPAESGMCAPLARVVFAVAKPSDPAATGLQVRARGTARFILTKHPAVHVWHSHTLVRTKAHHVDALTGPAGCEVEEYLDVHWSHPEALEMLEVDVSAVDPGVQNVEE